MTKTVSKATKRDKCGQWIELADICDTCDQPFSFYGPRRVGERLHRWWRRYHPCFGQGGKR